MQDDNAGSPSPTPETMTPPRPASAFHWDRVSWGYALRAAPLATVAQHLFTSKQLGLRANGTEAETQQAWSALSSSIGVTPGDLLRVKQVHGRVVRVVTRENCDGTTTSQRPEGDAVVSNVPGKVLAVVVADCVPILLADPERGAVAAIHAGWRGTCASVASATLQAMREAFGTRPENVIAAIGPSIGPQDYEVGPSLLEAFTDAGHDVHLRERWFRRKPDGVSLVLDLWQANRDQLELGGVRSEAVVSAGLSTVPHPQWLESFRRDGPRAGRMVAAIAVPRP